MDLESTDVAIARLQERVDSLPCGEHGVYAETIVRLETKVDSLVDTMSCTIGKVDDIHKKLFVGNGEASLFTQVDRHNQVIKALVWTARGVVGAIITAVVGGVVYLIRGGQ